MAFVGIDLGTTNSLITIWKDGKVELLKNNLGHNMTPSVVGVDDEGNLLVGEVAKQRRISHPALTAAEFKRNMGTDTKYTLGQNQYLAEDLSALVLKKLITDAENVLQEPITDAVISVPAYFDDNQREATKRAAKLAGIHVKRLINEPSAAVLYQHHGKNKTLPSGIYLVIDFGGGTLDISVVECFENIIEILAVAGNNQLGGKDFDKLIAEDFCNKNSLDFDHLSSSTQANILWTAENVKKALSENQSVTMRIVMNDQTYETTYTGNDLLRISEPLLLQLKQLLNDAFRDANITTLDIVDIILVGGTCKMPVVQKYLSALFKRDLTADTEGDYFVAYGAGMLTGIIERKSEISDIVMTDVCPFSLGIESTMFKDNTSKGNYMSVIIPKNSILPTSKTEYYHGLKPFQKKINISIYQGENLLPDDNLFLGEFDIDVTPNQNGDTSIAVTFCYDIDGILEVTAKDQFGEHTAQTVIVNKHSNLSEEEIEEKRKLLKTDQRLEVINEENQNLLAWAQRLYAQADTITKNLLSIKILDFEKVLKTNDIIEIRRMKQVLLADLLKLEMIVNRDYFDNDDIITTLLED